MRPAFAGASLGSYIQEGVLDNQHIMQIKAAVYSRSR